MNIRQSANKRTLWILIFVASNLVALLFGLYLGGKTSYAFLKEEFERVEAPIRLSHYLIFRDLARDVKNGHTQNALCSAELGASSNLEAVRRCLEKKSCRSLIESDVNKLAPEVLSNAPLGFTFRKSKDGVRRCD